MYSKYSHALSDITLLADNLFNKKNVNINYVNYVNNRGK